jgi:predicted SAM-dependent methyltransferase
MALTKNTPVFYALKQFKYLLNNWAHDSFVRFSIRRSRNDLKIIIGSAATKQEGWISTNYPSLDLTDDTTFSVLFSTATVSNFLAEHVWEHLSPDEAAKACQNCFAYLKSGGILRIAVPDGLHPDPAYIEHVRPGGSGPGSDDHKALYTYETLSGLLESAGFEIRLLEWFDEQGNFHHEEWDVRNGFIMRSTRFDQRNQINPTAYTSLIVDARRP